MVTWLFGENGHLREMGAIIRATNHQGKWVFGARNWAKKNF